MRTLTSGRHRKALQSVMVSETGYDDNEATGETFRVPMTKVERNTRGKMWIKSSLV